AEIFKKIYKLKDSEKLVLAVSDEHAGGFTSCMPEAKAAIDGMAAHAHTVLMNGDDFEYESPKAFLDRMPEFQKKYGHLGSAAYKEALHKEAVAVLHTKVTEDIASIEEQLEAHPERRIVKVIGNHENFATFRDALMALEAKYTNFQWTPEMAIISMPGGSKEKRDRLLAVHGDLQMDDLWFVEEGGTDRERRLHTHESMADKVVGIATKYLAPSAQKQEKGQSIVNWWRKPNATAKTLYTELLFRAQEGDFYQAVKKTELDKGVLETTEAKLHKRRKKFESFKAELAENKTMLPDAMAAEMLVYDRAIERIDKHLERIAPRLDVVQKKSLALGPTTFKSPRSISYYKKAGEVDAKLFTSNVLEKISHINYGHTHVSAEGVAVNGLGGKEITVSNNASVTGAIMKKPLDAKGKPGTTPKGEEPQTELGNLGVLLYRVKDGKITEITTMGRLITENIHLVRQMVRQVPKLALPPVPANDVHAPPIHPDEIRRRLEGQNEGTGGPP
ncbi:MAG: hypothetical protein K2Q01_04305, partial [Rickettsiales bacterium]|nr:hypothetical protein [Rickettsiales bacterium]